MGSNYCFVPREQKINGQDDRTLLGGCEVHTWGTFDTLLPQPPSHVLQAAKTSNLGVWAEVSRVTPIPVCSSSVQDSFVHRQISFPQLSGVHMNQDFGIHVGQSGSCQGAKSSLA
jgi:hypothetical protein